MQLKFAQNYALSCKEKIFYETSKINKTNYLGN